MKIGLFTEIFDCGGADTFITNLINLWPEEEDSFIIIANSNYPGLNIIENKVFRPCEIIRHRVPIFTNFLCNTSFQMRIKKILTPVVRYLFIIYNIFAFKKLFRTTNLDFLVVINGGYPGGDSCRAAGISWGLFCKKVYSIHNFHSLAVKSHWAVCLQEYVIDLLLRKKTSHFVTVSRAAAESMNVRSAIQNRAIFIHNGIVMRQYRLKTILNIRKELGIPKTAPLCLMLSTYQPLKGHYFLFRVFKKVLDTLPDAHLLICGYGSPDELKTVNNLVDDFNFNDIVHLMGFRNDIEHLLENSDVLVVASQSQESLNFTSVEAMAHHVPVVATNVGGIPEVVVNNEGGYCVDKDDVDLFSHYIVKLLKDEKLRKEQGIKGYERFKKHFTAERMARQYSELIRGLLKE